MTLSRTRSSIGMALSYHLVLALVMTTGIITFFSLSTVLGNQVLATSSDDENQDDDDNDSDNGSGDSSSNDNSLLPGGNGESRNTDNTGDGTDFGSLPGGLGDLGGSDTEVDPAESDPSGVITKVNENISTYENAEHGFAFEFPGHWNRTSDESSSSMFTVPTSIDEGILSRVNLEPTAAKNVSNIVAEIMPSLLPSLTTPTFEVRTYRVASHLDPETLEVRNSTAEEFGRKQAQIVESMGLSSSSSTTIQIFKNEATTIANKSDAWRLDYITSVGGKQDRFNIDAFVIDDEGKLYKFLFSTSPTSVPELLPDFEKILQSFRFV